jgi:hypothetical protein
MSLVHAVRQIRAWKLQEVEADTIIPLAEHNKQLLDALCDLLELSPDYSMAASLKRLETADPLGGIDPHVNSHTELTLKGNAENSYCRSHHYELARHVYTKETAVFWDYVLGRIESGDRAEWEMPSDFSQKARVIEDAFYATPLSEMAPNSESGSTAMVSALNQLQTLLKQLPTE